MARDQSSKSSQGVLSLSVACLLLLAVEITTPWLELPRFALTWTMSGVERVANIHNILFDLITNYLSDRNELLQQLHEVQAENQGLQVRNQRIAALEQSNAELRALLNIVSTESKLDFIVAEISSRIRTPTRNEVYINRGQDFGIESGSAVIDVSGVVGQVVEVFPTMSRLILLTDKRIAVPSRVRRTGLNLVVSGAGDDQHLEVEYATVTLDIKEGDVLITSGLGGVYPFGYPIGIVKTVRFAASGVEASITVEPTANIHRRRWLLILIGEE